MHRIHRCIESFNARLRDELLHGEIFHTLSEVQILIEAWCHRNATRPHGSLGYQPPAPENDHSAKLTAWLRSAARPAWRRNRRCTNIRTESPRGCRTIVSDTNEPHPEQQQPLPPPRTGNGATEAAAPPAVDPQPIEFTGKALAYSGIWYSTTVLSIITLGVYSAWAKVRRTRYLLGNTIVLGDALQYHATGLMILKGRLLVSAVFAVYIAIGWASVVAQVIFMLALIPCLPWVLNRAMRFNARMISWRNVRFDWHGQYWGMARVYLLWPLIALLTLGVLAPMAARAGREYLANNYAFGRERFAARTPLKPYYWAFAQAILLGLMVTAMLAAVGAAVLLLVAGEISNIRSLGGTYDVLVFLPLLVVLGAFSGMICFIALARNIIISALTLGDAAEFRSRLRPLRFLWILLSNVFVILFTAFLMTPWTHIRAYRYQAGCISVRPAPEVQTFLDTEARSGHAFAEEFGAMEGIEIGI